MFDVYNKNEILEHKKFGRGRVITIDGNYVTVRFESAGDKIFPKESFLNDYFKKVEDV